MAIVSESGCPGVADPGATIVARAQEQGLRVKPLVGPSSILLALMESVRSDDPTALIGLPLIATVKLLAKAGCPVLPGLE